MEARSYVLSQMSKLILLKNLRSSFESLRTNGEAVEIMGDFSVHAERVEALLGFFSRIIYKRFAIRFRQLRHEAGASFAPDGSCWK